MIPRILILCLAILCCSHTFALPNTTIKRVVYITLDGVRWQDVFLDKNFFRKLWQQYAIQSQIYGAPNSDTHIETASIAYSLPSYQSQMAGKVTSCNSNFCGPISAETLPEKIVAALHLKKKEVAVFASWIRVGLATEHIPGKIYVNTGNAPVFDPETFISDPTMIRLNIQQRLDAPPNLTGRYDRYTLAQAQHYISKYKPYFLWISFNDADDAAHDGNLTAYHNALFFYDEAISAIIAQLQAMHVYDETLVIITTDHGRGEGRYWTDHGPLYPESKQTWAFVLNGALIPDSETAGIKRYSTLSIRPSVEKALRIS